MTTDFNHDVAATLADLEQMRDDLAEKADQRAAADEPITCEFPESDGFCGADGTIFRIIDQSEAREPKDRQQPILACTTHVGPSMGADLPASYVVNLVQEQA